MRKHLLDTTLRNTILATGGYAATDLRLLIIPTITPLVVSHGGGGDVVGTLARIRHIRFETCI